MVTGIRFIKKNRIIHLQIQEGELLPLGGINETTVKWKPIDPYTINDEDVTVGKDFHMLTWESRSLDLDDLTVPERSIITGKAILGCKHRAISSCYTMCLRHA